MLLRRAHDTHGHPAGDGLLKVVAERLRHTIAHFPFAELKVPAGRLPLTEVGFLVGAVIGLLSVGAWAEQSPDEKMLIAAHRQAAVEAQKKVDFHEKMAKNFVAGRGGSKIDMVGHCRFWADYYQKVAEQEEQAAQELEGKAR